MHYDTFKTWLLDTIEKASPTRRFVFARETVCRVMNAPTFTEIDQGAELNASARTAFLTARRDVLTSSPDVLKQHLDVVDSGVLTDGNMDPRLLFMLEALHHWACYQEKQKIKNLIGLADVAINQIDWHVGASIDDFLAFPEMRAERDRIAELLVV